MIPGEILGVGSVELGVLALLIVVGATVQGLVGLGLNLVSAPILTLLEPSLMPELPLVLAALLPLLTLAHSREEIDWPGLGWMLSARIPGTVLGVLLLGLFSDRALGLAVAVMVLLSVAVTLRAVRVPVNRPTLTAAGLVAGVTATTTSIGGPPVALLYQHRSATQIRSTLGVFFAVGALISLIGIGLGGGLDTRAIGLGIALSPTLLVGAFAGVRLRAVFPEPATRYAVLAVCAASALVLLVRSIM
ncbi:MAG: sulfite exporter TauE/SafE family protein [Marmoricola sp.]